MLSHCCNRVRNYSTDCSIRVGDCSISVYRSPLTGIRKLCQLCSNIISKCQNNSQFFYHIIMLKIIWAKFLDPLLNPTLIVQLLIFLHLFITSQHLQQKSQMPVCRTGMLTIIVSCLLHSRLGV